MECRKCGSTNIRVQAITETKKKGKGCLYWLFIGWWLELIMWVFYTLPWLLIKIVKPKKTKSKTHKVGICQNCGNSWKL